MLGGEEYIDRGMLFGIWPRMGWGAGTEKQRRLWRFFDDFGIERAVMRGFWEGNNGVVMDRPDTYATAFVHAFTPDSASRNRGPRPTHGALLVVSTWHPPLQNWVGDSIDVSLGLDRRKLGLPAGPLQATDILTGEELDIGKPVPLRTPKQPQRSAFYEYRPFASHFEGRLIWVRGR
jgi:hypothetical protein